MKEGEGEEREKGGKSYNSHTCLILFYRVAVPVKREHVVLSIEHRPHKHRSVELHVNLSETSHITCTSQVKH